MAIILGGSDGSLYVRREVRIRGMPMPPHDEGVIIEMIAVGRYVKVTAVDVNSGREVSMVGDPRRGERALRDAAVRKLEYVMNKDDTEA
jgi:hypothetical protein